MRVFQLQRYSAIALLLFLGIHMAVMHYPPFEIDFRTVVIERLSNPVWKVIDIAFLLAVLVHALAGMYVVITDLQRFSAVKRGLAARRSCWASSGSSTARLRFSPSSRRCKRLTAPVGVLTSAAMAHCTALARSAKCRCGNAIATVSNP